MSKCPVCGEGFVEHNLTGHRGSPAMRPVDHIKCVIKMEAINNTNRDGWRDAALDNERLCAERDEAWERCPDWAVYNSNLRKARDRADEAESEQYRLKHLYEAERRVRRADDERMVALKAEQAILKAEVELRDRMLRLALERDYGSEQIDDEYFEHLSGLLRDEARVAQEDGWDAATEAETIGPPEREEGES